MDKPTRDALHSNQQKSRFNLILGSALGLGLSPFAPGTCGTLLGVAAHILIATLLPTGWRTAALIAVLLLVCVANHLLTPWAREYWRSSDPKNFVLDEIAGYLIVPILFHHGELWQIIVWGFLLFRGFDLIKFPPARQIDRHMKNSWGIILDDIVSGFYAVAVMYCMFWIGQRYGLETWFFTNN